MVWTRHYRKDVPHDDIVKAQAEMLKSWRFAGLGYDPRHCCWACGLWLFDDNPTRCHIIPVSRGGGDDPSNFLLLCNLCHEAHPDGTPLNIQLEWMNTRETSEERHIREAADMERALLSVSPRIQEWYATKPWDGIVSALGMTTCSMQNLWPTAMRLAVAQFREWVLANPAHQEAA